MRQTFARRLLLVSAFVAVLVAGGTTGFVQLGWSVSDALYMTWITLTAVGYQEVRPLTDAGRLLASGLLAGGITSMGLYWALITSLIVEIDLGDVLRRRQMNKELERMRDHVIVCGVGRTGRQVVRELAGGDGNSFVVIEHDEERAEAVRDALDDEPVVIVDDATHDETLERARIDRARGLISALSRDEDNLYVTLSARALNPDLTIVARAQEEETMNKLYRAGADHVVSPNLTGGARMASALLRPHVLSFLDVITGAEGLALRLEEVLVPEGSSLAGHTLEEARIPQKTGLIVIAVRGNGAGSGHADLEYNPGPEVRLDAGDVLIVLGKPKQVDRLRELTGEEA